MMGGSCRLSPSPPNSPCYGVLGMWHLESIRSASRHIRMDGGKHRTSGSTNRLHRPISSKEAATRGHNATPSVASRAHPPPVFQISSPHHGLLSHSSVRRPMSCSPLAYSSSSVPESVQMYVCV